MDEPTFDRNGYPTDETLKAITEWPYANLEGLFTFINGAWNLNYGTMELCKGRLQLATGGWSGNEGIIGALMSNQMAYSLTWQESKRGGWYVFILPEAREHWQK